MGANRKTRQFGGDHEYNILDVVASQQLNL